MNENKQAGGEYRRPGDVWGHVGINSDRWQLPSCAKDTHEWTRFCPRLRGSREEYMASVLVQNDGADDLRDMARSQGFMLWCRVGHPSVPQKACGSASLRWS